MRSIGGTQGSAHSQDGGSTVVHELHRGLQHVSARGHPSPQVLLRTVESSVIPRLMLAYSRRMGAEGAARGPSFTAADIRQFACLCTANDVAPMLQIIEGALNDGHSLDNIYLELFAPAARELGLMWAEDQLTFMQVTLGSCRLHHALCEYSARDPQQSDHNGRSIMLAPVPGDQHTLGVVIVAEFFRRAGWCVDSPLDCEEQTVLSGIEQEHFDLLGISVSRCDQATKVATLIERARACSRNPALQVLVGGPALAERPELLLQVGADALARDGADAVRQGELAIARVGLQGAYVN